MGQHGKVFFLLGGPCLLLLARCFLAGIFGVYGSLAMGIALWMIFWWITRPVALTVTALLPVVANAFFALAPMDQMLAQYASSSIVLLFAATLLTLPWERIGLDHRIALRCLAFIGPTMKSQITVWFLAAFLSEVSSITISAALTVPLVISYTQSAGLPLLPYWMAAVMGFNGAFLLPTGIRAIPCGAGLSSRELFRRGLPVFAVRLLCAVGMGWLAGLG